MKRIITIALISFLISSVAIGQKPKWISEGWLLFTKVKFEPRLFKEFGETFLVPLFTPSIKGKIGTEISLSGYYMPFDLGKHRVILSKYPYSACFFCGGAGPESVVEVVFTETAPKLKVDQILSVRGKLRLNDKDVEHMNFILYDAALLE